MSSFSPFFRLFLAGLLVAVLWWLWTHDEPEPETHGEVMVARNPIPFPDKCRDELTDGPNGNLWPCLVGR